MQERRRNEQEQDVERERSEAHEAGDESPAADRLPGLPADDDAPLGDTDQHSDA